MPTITWTAGDRFTFVEGKRNDQKGVGIVLPDGQALLIKGEGGRTSYQLSRESVPTNAVPVQGDLNSEVSFALKAVSTAMGLPSQYSE
jgi:hypothetical protein